MSNYKSLQRQLLVEQAKVAIEVAKRASRDPETGFKFFVNTVFSKSFDNFVSGDYIDGVTDRMIEHRWTMDVTARDHFKSTRLYAEIMHAIFTAETNIECHYFSYNTDLARYHLEKIKNMVARNPFFTTVRDNKERADSAMDYTNGKGRVTVQPAGLNSFKRGIHAERIYIDDPLRDPENKVKPTVINKINRVIATEIYPMVNKNGYCRIVGTPQTYADFFFDEKLRQKWSVEIHDAIVDEVNKTVLWPEWKTFEELMFIRDTIGEKTFNQEYRTKPAYAEESYISRKNYMACINPALKNIPMTKFETTNDVVAGFDIGKHAHPSHLAVFERWYKNDQWYYKQILSKWMDKWTYTDQVEYLSMVCDLFSVTNLRYDNTRGEFESFDEQGKLPQAMKPKNLIGKFRHGLSTNFDAITTSQRVEYINDKRQTEQILAVNDNLEAVESADGHGDSFWSVALALNNEKPKVYRVRSV